MGFSSFALAMPKLAADTNMSIDVRHLIWDPFALFFTRPAFNARPIKPSACHQRPWRVQQRRTLHPNRATERPRQFPRDLPILPIGSCEIIAWRPSGVPPE